MKIEITSGALKNMGSLSLQAENSAELLQLRELREQCKKYNIWYYNFDDRIDGGNSYGLGVALALAIK